MKPISQIKKVLPMRATFGRDYKNVIVLDRFGRGVKTADFVIFTPLMRTGNRFESDGRGSLLGLVTGIEEKEAYDRSLGERRLRKHLHLVVFEWLPGQPADECLLRKTYTLEPGRTVKVNINELRDVPIYGMAIVLQQHLLLKLAAASPQNRAKAVDVIKEIGNDN